MLYLEDYNELFLGKYKPIKKINKGVKKNKKNVKGTINFISPLSD
jgi:hypothetical protein